MASSNKASVQVICRFRPLNALEKDRSTGTCVRFGEDGKSVTFVGSNSEKNVFNFDRVYNESSTQADVYEFAAQPVVEDVLQGYNGTVFAYGQTSCGKTHTMEGPVIDDPKLKGIIPRMVKTIFDWVDSSDENTEFQIKVSYIEIYMERIRDLFDPLRDNLQVHEDKQRGIYVAGATEVYVTCEQEVLDLMREGASNRAVAATKMNLDSSRSHGIVILSLMQKCLKDLSTKTGKLYLVDLAGSERVGKTGAEGQTLEEAKNINKSLSCLGNVINALTDSKSTHVPYRDSKLTRVLQDSLGGNSRTCLIICCSPSVFNEAETLSTLRFGLRAKSIQNTPKVNKERSVQELTKLLALSNSEIERNRVYIASLQEELEVLRRSAGVASAVATATPPLPNVQILQDRCDYLEIESRTNAEKLAHVEDALQTAKDEVSAQEELYMAAKKELDELQNKHERLVKDYERMLQEVSDFKYKNDKLHEELEENSIARDDLLEAKRHAEHEIDQLRGKLVAFQRIGADSGDTSPKDRESARSLTPTPGSSSSEALNAVELYTELYTLKHLIGVLQKENNMLRSYGNTTPKSSTAPSKPPVDVEVQVKQALDTVAASDQSILKKKIEELVRTGVDQQAALDDADELCRKLATDMAALKESQVKQTREFETVKMALSLELQKRTEQIVELEVQLDEAVGQQRRLEKKISSSGGKKSQEYASLQHKNDQLQHQLVTAGNKVKEELGNTKKMMMEKEERIAILEVLLQDARESANRYKDALTRVDSELTALKTSSDGKAVTGGRTNVAISGERGRMVRAIRGGGGSRRVLGEDGGFADGGRIPVRSPGRVPISDNVLTFNLMNGSDPSGTSPSATPHDLHSLSRHLSLTTPKAASFMHIRDKEEDDF